MSEPDIDTVKNELRTAFDDMIDKLQAARDICPSGAGLRERRIAGLVIFPPCLTDRIPRFILGRFQLLALGEESFTGLRELAVKIRLHHTQLLGDLGL